MILINSFTRLRLSTCALLCLVLALQLAAAHSFQLIPRATTDVTTPDATNTVDSSPSTNSPNQFSDTARSQDEDDATASETRRDPISNASSLTSTPTDTSTTTTDTESTSSPSPTDSIFHNATIPPGQLPITPQITPGWGVAGIIMIFTGLVYGLVGIKNPWIHSFFSAAYVAALGISVLIVYVMNVPVSNALQGGYVTAIVLSGCTVGAAAMFFKELTESLGCALGGFCISMWLLCLVPGGLLHSTAAKAIFIACFTLFGFGLYFSRFTRDASMIVLIAFSGATISVLGIDSFSRAGLKEFWAYIWALNDNLFPLGANTYPVTRGIRVETAAIIIIFLIATMCQIRLWKIVRNKRQKRAALRAQDQRDMDREEEHLGRQIEESNARDRAEWERVYRDGAECSMTASHVSSGLANEKKRVSSNVYTVRDPSGEVTETGDVSEFSETAMDQLLMGETNDGAVTVRVAADDVPDGSMHEKDHGSHMTEQRGFPTSSRLPPRFSTFTPPPPVVPLPFNVPQTTRPRSQCSSVATFADAQDDAHVASSRRTPRNSVVKRLSQGSADLLRSLSQRSAPSAQCADKPIKGASSEILVFPGQHRQEPENESIVATMDDESVSGGDDRSTVHGDYETSGPEGEHKEASAQQDKAKAADSAENNNHLTRQENKHDLSKQDKRDSLPSQVNVGPQQPSETHPTESIDESAQPAMPKSSVSDVSAPVSLTKDRLPSSLSRVALSYRTNEWAKHLSYADLPEMDKIAIENKTEHKTVPEERVRPVNVQDLQKTAEDGTPAPAIPRSMSRVSLASSRVSPPTDAVTCTPAAITEPPPTWKAAAAGRESWAGASTPAPPDTPANMQRIPPSSSLNIRRTSTPRVQPIQEESGSTPSLVSASQPESDSVMGPTTETDLATDPARLSRISAVPGIIPYSAPQTLLGKREMFLRSRSRGSLASTVGEMMSEAVPYAPPSDAGSTREYLPYAPALAGDSDDVPLRQRQSMLMRANSGGPRPMNDSRQSLLYHTDSRPGSIVAGAGVPPRMDSPGFYAQPTLRRQSGLMATQAAREAQLANFRFSVSQDLRGGSPAMASMMNVNGAGLSESNLQRDIEIQRHVLLGQKEAEAQRREMQRRDKEHSERVFDDRMRSGDMLEAHREAMRKMQRGAR